MDQAKKEQMIETYFNMWIERNFDQINSIFSPGIYYSECYGPEYHGLEEIHSWIKEMTEKQTVLEWSIKRYIHQGSAVAVEWFFQDQVDGVVNGFDGVSIIEFQGDGAISAIKEFGSKAKAGSGFNQKTQSKEKEK